MKKKRTNCVLKRTCFKLLRIMRLTTAFILFAVLTVHAKSYSQQTQLSFSFKQTSIADVLAHIEEKSEFYFFYKENELHADRLIDIDVSGEDIHKILSRILEGTNLTYSLIDRYVVISEKSDNNSQSGFQQDKTISGKVTDTTGTPLPGVTVVIKGTSQGTITGADGNYSLADVPSNATLVFSFVGMKTQELEVSGKSEINVKMEEDAIGIEEVVAVGYGTMKKANLTGSVSNFKSDQIENKPVTKISQVFAGQITGVSATQISGEPGEDNAEIIIRGRGTYSKAGYSPLVLVDGITSSLENLDPNSIESISVLKDAASSAIYGARAANGVILVTTKKGGTGKINVNYNTYGGWVKPAELPEYVDSWKSAMYYNEGLVNAGSQPQFSDVEIQKMKDGSDPDNYANCNHVKDLFSSGSGFQTNHNLNFSGGNEKNVYFASFTYLEQNGLVAENWYKRYNYTLNVSQEVAKDLKLNASVVGYSGIQNAPAVPAGITAGNPSYSTVRTLYQMAAMYYPWLPIKTSDGTYPTRSGWNNYKASIDSDSFNKDNQNYFLGNVSLEWNILKSLKISGKVGYSYDQNYSKIFNATFKYSDELTTKPSWLMEEITNKTHLTLQSLVEYNKTIDKHNFHVLAGIVQERYKGINHNLTRNTFPSNFTTVMNAGSKDSQKNGGGISEWALLSYIGRIQYSYNDKYLFEANARYDGSSRFHPDYRFGFFPSFSGAWRLSNESFFNIPWIDNMKMRASWGTLGNQDVGTYPYQNTLRLGRDYAFGGRIQSGAALSTLANRSISWETTRMIDIGVDVACFDNKLFLLVDYFDKKTSDIIDNIPASGVLGFSPSVVNAGKVENKGWEFELSYKDRIGNFSYNISPNFSIVQTKILELPNAKKIVDIVASNYWTIKTEGQPMSAFYGFKTDGLFVDQSDIDAYPKQPYQVTPGCIRYKDISGPNGVPDGKVDEEYDRTVLGSHFPKCTFGALLEFRYKNFDFSTVLQGVAGVKGILTRWRARPFDDGGVSVQKWQEDRWTEANPDRNARLPRYLVGWDSSNNVSSDFWVVDASYLRIKNVQIGYTIPSSVTNKIKIDQLRIYFSATNLHTFSDYYKGYDPDMRLSPDQRIYPVTSTYTLGINLDF